VTHEQWNEWVLWFFPAAWPFLMAVLVGVIAFAFGRIDGYAKATAEFIVNRPDLEEDEPEEQPVARKPLTAEQLKECLDSNGLCCPRCGDDADVEYQDPDVDENADCVTQSGQCGGCNEEWELVYRLAEVRPAPSGVSTGNNGV
jgi:hypothetical protein